MNGYVFLVRPTIRDGLVVDSFLDVSPYICDGEFEDISKVMKVRIRLNPDDKEAAEWDRNFNGIVHSIEAMRLRARYNQCEGPLMVRCEHPLSLDEVELYIKYMSTEQRDKFFRESRL